VSRIVSNRCFSFACFAAIIAVTFVPRAHAEGPYIIGSSNTVTADPPVPRPKTAPCVVTLFSGVAFQDFNPFNFTYSPPGACPGPWAKVVFESDISVTEGIQFDRTANFWIGGAAIYFGTTAEPSPTLGPSWHVESELTDYSPLFMTTQAGQADIGNLVNSQYTGIIYASATLEFYPLAAGQTPPVTPDEVLPLSASSEGGTVALNSGTDQLSATFNLPLNTEQLYLDVYAQSQSNDEFWYTCVPNDVSGELFSCGNTAFRETEVSVDGTPAGVAPVYPWIFTGGIDPYLWFPLPGVQTLNFKPYRVNLTPFAGKLTDGQPHTVALSVYNADSYFSATASLLVYSDHGSQQTTGDVVLNTIGTGPNPNVVENLQSLNGNVTGNVTVTSNRQYQLSGYVDTSHGRVWTAVNQTMNFSSSQDFLIDATRYTQNITQNTAALAITKTTNNGVTTTATQDFVFPLNLGINENFNADGSGSLTTTVHQTYLSLFNSQKPSANYRSSLTNTENTVDTLDFDSSGNITGTSGQKSSQSYSFSDSQGHCYGVGLFAANNALTGAKNLCK
jgi:Peptide N-acetyl-beta-D-glucosaminyl asparaginase amidase A